MDPTPLLTLIRRDLDRIKPDNFIIILRATHWLEVSKVRSPHTPAQDISPLITKMASKKYPGNVNHVRDWTSNTCPSGCVDPCVSYMIIFPNDIFFFTIDV